MKSVTVRTLPDYTYSQIATDGRHALVSDEPSAAGGDDLGPNPYELLLASLGACTSITLQMYAERKQWPLYEVGVALTHDKVHAADCAECTDEERAAAGPEGRIDVIRLELSFRGDLTAEQTQRLLEIAERCPVHRTLAASPKLVTTMART
jgi:putative redox protein